MLSVIVPVYNTEKYIEESLSSLKKQKSKDVEFLIINDGSTDNSQLIIDKFVREDGRFRSFNKENGGLSDARNYGLSYIKGDYVLFFDSDDILDENAIELINKEIEQNPDCIVFDFKFFWEKSEKTKIVKGMNIELDDNIKALLISSPSACNKIFKKEYLINNKFIKDIYYEDLAIIPNLISRCHSIKYINKPLYLYRQREGSIIYSYTNKTKDVFVCLKNILDYYKNNGLFDAYYSELEYLCVEHLLLNGNRRFYHSEKPNELFKESKKFIDSYFNNCLNNKYFQRMSSNDKLFIKLSYGCHYNLLKILIGIKGLIK